MSLYGCTIDREKYPLGPLGNEITACPLWVVQRQVVQVLNTDRWEFDGELFCRLDVDDDLDEDADPRMYTPSEVYESCPEDCYVHWQDEHAYFFSRESAELWVERRRHRFGGDRVQVFCASVNAECDLRQHLWPRLEGGE